MSARSLRHLARHLLLGRSGEDAAVRHLESLGYRILARNWSKRRYEIDIVCEQGDTLVFAEVKTRAENSRGTPADALTPSKQGKLARAAALYLSEQDAWERPCRFDLLCVVPCDQSYAVEHIPDCFHLENVPGIALFFQPF